MNKKKFELQFDAKMELSDIKKQLNALSGSLEKLEIPAGMAKNLEKALTKTLDQLNNFETQSEKGMETLADTKKLEKSWSQIMDSLNAIGTILKSMDTAKLFPKEARGNIEAAEKAMSNYIQKLEQAKKTAAYQVEEKKRDDSLKDERVAQELLDKAKRKLMSAEAEFEVKKNSWGEEAQQRYAAEQAELEEINKKLKTQEDTLKRLNTEKERLRAEGYMTADGEVSVNARRGKEGFNDPKKLKRAETVASSLKTASGAKKAYEGKQKEVKSRLKESETLEKEYKEAERAVKETRESVEQLTIKLNDAQEATKILEQAMENIAKGEAATFWKELLQVLQKIPGLNLDESAQDIEAVKQALQGYRQSELDKAPKAAEELKQELKETEAPAKNVSKALGGVVETAEDMEKAADEIENLKNQILDFFSISNAISIFKQALSDAFQTIKELDAVMTEAAVVTDFSIGDMWEQMPQYSKNASELGVATKELYAATTLYYQQGLKGNDVMNIGIETMKMAKIASMDATEATEAMTAALRGFNMQVDEMNAQKVNDVYSKLAAVTAADTSQIATAMSKTASIAASANMEFETTAAFLAQIIETTQEAPETAGTALKTIIARFSEVKQLQSQGLTSGVDTEGEAIDINKISTALRSVGISMDAFFAGQGGLDDVLLRLSEKWGTLDFQTQHYIATMAAGSRQQSRFIAMMSNYERTMELVGEANNSAGASQEQYEKTLDSLDAKLTQLKNAWDQFTMGLANDELVKFGVDTLTWILETVNKLTDAISGGSGLAKSIVSLGAVIGALKLGGKILGKNSPTGGLLGKVSGLVSGKNDTKKEYARGRKDGQSYGQGWKDGVKVATSKMPDPPELAPDNLEEVNNNLDKTTTKFNILGGAIIGVGTACGLLATAFQAAGMEEAAEVTQTLAAVFTTLGTVIPIVGQLIVTFGGEAAAAGLGVQAAWWPLLLITAAVAAIAVTWALVAKSIKEKSFEHRLEKAKEATENAKQAAEEAKAAYDELLDAKSGYSELQKTLDNLTKGTNKWRMALVESNQQVLELLEKYPQLSKYITTNEYGQMAIADEGFVELEGQLVEQSRNSQAALVATQGYEGGLVSEESVRAILKEGKIKQSDRDQIVEWVKTQDEESLKSYLSDRQLWLDSAKSSDGILNLWETRYGKQVGAMEDILASLNTYSDQMAGYAEALKAQTQALLIYTKDDTKTSEYSGYGSAYANKNADRIAQDIETKTSTYLSDFNTEEAMRTQYKTAMGYDAAEGMSLEAMAREMAGVEVAKIESEKVDEVVKRIEEIEDDTVRENTYAMLTGDTSHITLDDLGLAKEMSMESIAKAMGYETITKMLEETGMTIDDFTQQRGDFELQYKDYIQGIGSKTYLQNRDFFNSLSLNSIEKLIDQFESGDLDQNQRTNLVSALQNVLTDTDLEEGDRAVLENILATTDWTNPFSALDTVDQMFAMGIDQDTIEEYWEAATAGVQSYVDTEAEALQLAGRMQNKVKSLGDLSDRMAEGTLTVDDMVMLEKAGVDTSNYKLTAEGWQATSEEIEEATEKMREFDLMQTSKNLKDTWAAWARETDPAKKEELWESYKILEKTREMLEQPITTTYKVETHIDLLDRIKEAIVFDRQKEIDKLSEINDTIADSNSRIVTAMRESVEASRQARENERTEQEIADKQARLAYLKMDASGANAMEIKRLEEEIAQDQESYTDRLIDQKISALEEQNNIAQEQRAQQIELMQLQLEHDQQTGALWTYVEELFKEGYDSTTGKLREDSEAYKLLYQAENVASMSILAQEEWKNELLEAFEGVHIHIYPPEQNPDKEDEVINTTIGDSLSTAGLGEKLWRREVSVAAYASGGLADFTGPAWLDGTKTNPEYVLSAAQTERFFTLVDILEGLKVAPANSTQNNRESNFDIDINVESINSDYDVEQVAIKVKDFIVNSSRYRNNNTL